MAFEFTIKDRTVFGDKRIVYGTFTNGESDTGGDIETGLEVVEYISVQNTGSSVQANATSVNESFPAGGDITIVTDSGVNGIWYAVGR